MPLIFKKKIFFLFSLEGSCYFIVGCGPFSFLIHYLCCLSGEERARSCENKGQQPFLFGCEEHSLNCFRPKHCNWEQGRLQQVQGCIGWSVSKARTPLLNSCPCLADQAHEAAEQLCSYPGVQRVAPPLAPVAAGGSLVPLPLSPCISPTVNSIGSMSVQVVWQAEWGSWIFYLFSSTWCFAEACALRVFKLLVVFFKTAFWRKCLFFWICIKTNIIVL